jgi:hypothetical protein
MLHHILNYETVDMIQESENKYALTDVELEQQGPCIKEPKH